MDFTTPGDPARQWGGSVSTGVGYDDNVNTTPNSSSSNRVSSGTINVNPQTWLSIPGDQTSAQLQYAYNTTYYMGNDNIPPDQSHSLNASLTHAFTPRWITSFTENFVRGLEPALVQQQISGTPIITQQRGDYYYNNLTGGLNFLATGRWSLTGNQGWDVWSFDELSQAEANNRDDYTTLLTASYELTPQTFVGGSYRFGLTDYTTSGGATNAARNSTSHAVYATVVHRFNPLVIAQANAGIQTAGFTGSTDLSPYLSLSGSYNFGANSLVSAGFNYNIQVTEVAEYRSVDQAASYLSFQYRVTPKFHVSTGLTYVISSYQNLNPLYSNPNDITQKNSVSEDSWQVTAGTWYDVTQWAAVYFNYTYDAVESGLDNAVTGYERSFDRDQYSLGVRLTY